jgi:peptidoglycan hydrolase-like protein with peptidoglycan-binding domain
MAKDPINTQRGSESAGSMTGANQGLNYPELERYFHEPGLPKTLKPGMSGTAFCNIRTALSSLGLRREWGNADVYDEEMQSVVRKFQTDSNHPNVDGYVGPGTRRLLVKKFLDIDFDFTRLLPTFEYDVALSFAGEDRNFADDLAEILRRNDVRVFYDSYEQANLWGKPLIEHLEDVYSRRARFCVMFASKAYAEKAWPTHERRAAQERALNNVAEDYILPVRLDDTKIPGLPSTVCYIDIEKTGIDGIGRLLIDKIKQQRARTVSLWSTAHSNTFG